VIAADSRIPSLLITTATGSTLRPQIIDFKSLETEILHAFQLR
jgi:hypothetical protein